MKGFYIQVIICSALMLSVWGRFHLNSIQCRSVDKAFADFEYCYLKAVNRSYKYISTKVKLYKVPINNISVRFALKKRDNGYKPFLYDLKFNACERLKKKDNILARYFYNFFEASSNMNHTCPYDHDIIVHELGTGLVESQMMSLVPFPEGDYGVFTSWYAYNKKRAEFNFFVTIA